MGDFRQGGNRSSGGFGRGRPSGNRFGGGDRGRSGGFGGRSGGFRGRDSGFGGERRSFEMHEATCDKCGEKCKVPFKPSGDKPVYCSNCFEKQGQGNSNQRNGDSRRDNYQSKPSFNQSNSASPGISQEQFKQINTKLDKIIGFLENLEIDIVAEGEEDGDLDETLDAEGSDDTEIITEVDADVSSDDELDEDESESDEKVK